MTREDLLQTLRDIAAGAEGHVPGERPHYAADVALLKFIDDPEITAAFEAIEKWWS